MSDALRATLFSTADILYQVVHGLHALFCSDFKKHPHKAQAEWALIFRLFAAAQLSLARSSKFNFHPVGSLWGSTRSPTIKGLDLCIEGWLAYELLSSPSAIHEMKVLDGNEVDDEDDDEESDDEDVDDEEIGFGRPIRLSGNRILAGRAIPGIV
jgi:hypothetical protein